MSGRNLKNLLARTVTSLEDAIELTARADIWHNQLKHYQAARFKNMHYDQIVELAFMKSFLTWESFLEEAFLLYLLGDIAPTGYKPSKYVSPLNRIHAAELLKGESRHPDWTAADLVISRALRFFEHGRPFASTIKPRIRHLNNLKTVRNAVSHASAESKEKFTIFVRNELTYYPSGMTPGSFLMTLRPNSTPPQSYFAFYAEHLRAMVEAIVPK